MKIAGRTYNTKIGAVIKNAALLGYYEKFIKSRLASENMFFVFNYKIAPKRPIWLYNQCIDTRGAHALNIGGILRGEMRDAVEAPGGVDLNALRTGLADTYREIASLLDSNFRVDFEKSQQARDFAYSIVKRREPKIAKSLGIKKSAALSELKVAIIDFAMGNETAGNKALTVALTKQHWRGKKPSRQGLTRASKALKKLL